MYVYVYVYARARACTCINTHVHITCMKDAHACTHAIAQTNYVQMLGDCACVCIKIYVRTCDLRMETHMRPSVVSA